MQGLESLGTQWQICYGSSRFSDASWTRILHDKWPAAVWASLPCRDHASGSSGSWRWEGNLSRAELITANQSGTSLKKFQVKWYVLSLFLSGLGICLGWAGELYWKNNLTKWQERNILQTTKWNLGFARWQLHLGWKDFFQVCIVSDKVVLVLKK